MTQSTIFLMRHGQIPQVSPRRFVGQRDVPLDETGRKQAARAAELLAGAPIARVICSGLQRTRETAAIVAQGLGIQEVEDEPAFREIRLGAWEGLTTGEVRERFPEEYAARGAEIATFRPTGGESFQDVQQRALPALRDVAATGLPTLVVGHAGVNRALLCGVLGLPLANLFILGQDYCCLNALRLEGGLWQLTLLNLRIGDLLPESTDTLQLHFRGAGQA